MIHFSTIKDRPLTRITSEPVHPRGRRLVLEFADDGEPVTLGIDRMSQSLLARLILDRDDTLRLVVQDPQEDDQVGPPPVTIPEKDGGDRGQGQDDSDEDLLPDPVEEPQEGSESAPPPSPTPSPPAPPAVPPAPPAPPQLPRPPAPPQPPSITGGEA